MARNTERAYRVKADWDADARVWSATSDDVPGLCCEAPTFEKLVDVIGEIAPELIVANGLARKGRREYPIEIVGARRTVVRLAA